MQYDTHKLADRRRTGSAHTMMMHSLTFQAFHEEIFTHMVV